jgi:hypothetical protein
MAFPTCLIGVEMQYHYVVGFDSDNNRWWIEYDTTAYFPDGNIYNTEISKDEFPNTIYPGWFLPEEGSHEEKLDVALLKTLEYCIPDIMPIPTVEA